MKGGPPTRSRHTALGLPTAGSDLHKCRLAQVRVRDQGGKLCDVQVFRMKYTVTYKLYIKRIYTLN